MARTAQTPRKSTIAIETGRRRVDTFYAYCRMAGKSLVEFVGRYLTCWHRAHPYGVGGYDGIVLLVCALPNEWSEWAQATTRRFFRSNPPSVALDGGMKGFAKAMFDLLVDHPERPPPASTVEPPTRPLDLPLWTIPGREQGESSRSARAKRVRVEDRDRYDSEEEESDEESEYDEEEEGDGHEIGDGEEEEREHIEEEGKGKAALEEGDPDEDEDPEEGPYTETTEVEEAKFIPPPPLEPPPVIPPPPYEAAYEYPPPLPPSGPFYYVDYTIPMGYGYGARPGSAYYMTTTEMPLEPIVEPVIPEVHLTPLVDEIFADTHGKTTWDPIRIFSDSEAED